jgi:hypothetical protein
MLDGGGPATCGLAPGAAVVNSGPYHCAADLIESHDV